LKNGKVSELFKYVQDAFELKNFQVRYMDDEGEMVSILCQEDFDEAVRLSEDLGSSVLKVFVNEVKGEVKGENGIDSDEEVEEPKEVEVPSLAEVMVNLLHQLNEDQEFRSEVPEAVKIVVANLLKGEKSPQVILEEIFSNCKGIAENKYIQEIDLLNNWEKILQKSVEQGFDSFPCAEYLAPMAMMMPMSFGPFDLSFEHLNEVAEQPKQEEFISSEFVADVNYDDGEEVSMSRSPYILKSWKVKNNGTVAWPEATKLVVTDGDKEIDATSIFSEVPLAGVGETVNVTAMLKSPAKKGSKRATYRLVDGEGEEFGHWFWAELNYVD